MNEGDSRRVLVSEMFTVYKETKHSHETMRIEYELEEYRREWVR